MAILNFNLNDVTEKIAKTLEDSTILETYCQKTYGKSVTIFRGDVLPEECPDKADAPYIIVYGPSKDEGDHDPDAYYNVNIGCGIYCTSKDLITVGKQKYHQGFVERNDFQALIQGILDDMRQISKIHVDFFNPLDPDAGHWAANMDIQWAVTQVIGLGRTQEF